MKKLEEQMKSGDSQIKAVGKLLRSACEADKAAAERVEQALKKPEMSLQRCFERMRETAKKKQKEGCYYMSPTEAEKIIRGFYGIPGKKVNPQKPEQTAPPSSGILDLADLLEW